MVDPISGDPDSSSRLLDQLRGCSINIAIVHAFGVREKSVAVARDLLQTCRRECPRLLVRTFRGGPCVAEDTVEKHARVASIRAGRGRPSRTWCLPRFVACASDRARASSRLVLPRIVR
jgi:hypothetical protein